MLKVLVADDHPLFREAVVLSIRHLDRTDSQVLEAGTLDEVCRLATAMPDLDLLLLDLKMPGMDGLGGLLELRRRFPALPVVIVSATEEPRVIREAIAAGAMAYIPKSLDRASIVQALEHVLAGEIWQPEGDAEPLPDDALDRHADAGADAAAAQHSPAHRRGQAEQDHRLRPRHRRDDGEGAHHGDPAQARCLQPDPGRARGARLFRLGRRAAPASWPGGI